MGGLSLPTEWATVPSISTCSVGKDRDPLFVDVDAILVQGSGHPPLGHDLWQIPSLRAVVWTSPNSRGGRRNAPTGWRSFTRLFFHAKLGGVSDGQFAIGYAVREETEIGWASRGELFPNFIQQIWRPTEAGRQIVVPSLESSTENTSRGLLSWKTRHTCFVSGPTVFSHVKWASRRLTTRELADVCDMPADKFKQATTYWRTTLAMQKVPGKVLAQAVAALVWERDTPSESTQHCGKPCKGKSQHANEDRRLDRTACLEPNLDESGTNKRRLPGETGSNATGVERKSKRVRFVLNEPKGDEQRNFGQQEENEETWKGMFGDFGSKGTVSDKAVKSDAAGVPIQLWDRRLLEGTHLGTYLKEFPAALHRAISALEIIRAAALRWWKRRVLKSFTHWFVITTHESWEEKMACLVAGRQALWYVGHCSWWEWPQGSGILFWRWPLAYQREIREGVTPMFTGPPPSSMVRQPPYSSAEVRAQVFDKVSTVVGRGYIKKVSNISDLQSLMYMFHVPKGIDDVRMVYDGSKSGLNKVLFAPWFYIHSVEMMSRSLLPGYWCADNDYGEQFLNFNLHPVMQRLCGVDLSQLFSPGVRGSPATRDEIMGKWTRCAMGL